MRRGEMGSDSESSSPPPQINQENRPPMMPISYQSKRPNSDVALSSLPNKRPYGSPSLSGRDPTTRVLASRVFGGLATNVEDFDTFTSAEHRYEEHIMATMDTKVPKEELDWLLQSIPLEDRAKEGGDISETAMAAVFLKCRPDKLGNPVMPGMKVSLMQHQLTGVKWMVERENEPTMGMKVKIDDKSKNYGKGTTVRTVGGGLLADEMGLGKTIQSIALMVHNRAGPKEPIKTTLIVAPLALIHQWKREIEKRTKRGLFNVHIHHGSGQLKTVQEFAKYDVVITTYGTLMSGYPSNKIPRDRHMKDDERGRWDEWLEESKGVMFQMEWYRIILDEGHVIKNPSVRSSLACGALKSPRKWCLTGTPLHNSLKDMYSLFRFLEYPHFNVYSKFNEHFQADGARAGALRMQILLRGTMLRRKKDDKIDGRPLIILPEKTIKETYVELSADERQLYKAVEDRARVEINRYLREGVVMKNYSCILAMLVRLRQLCIHPYLILEHIQEKWTNDDVQAFMSQTDSALPQSTLNKLIDDITATPAGDWSECPLCLDVPANAVITVCRHVFCSECINGVFQMPNARGQVDEDDDDDVEEVGESIACPVCRHKLTRQSIGNFVPPGQKKELPPEEAREKYKQIVWEISSDDDSDNESLPDLATVFAKAAAKVKVKKEKTPVPAAVVVPVLPVSPAIPFDPNTEENLLEVFRNNPVPREEPKRQYNNVSQHWADILALDEPLSSAKLDTLRDQISEWQENHSEDKIIIFSQFVRGLDLVEKMCDAQGWRTTRYQGEMTLDQREASLRTFEDDDEVMIMLTSLKCGGVGLNLTVVLLDLWWNWQIENQAIDRAHRTGQKKPVEVFRIIVKNSVEERILALQEKKKTLAAAALGDEPSGRIGRLSVRELVGLFGRVTRDEHGDMRVE